MFCHFDALEIEFDFCCLHYMWYELCVCCLVFVNLYELKTSCLARMDFDFCLLHCVCVGKLVYFVFVLWLVGHYELKTSCLGRLKYDIDFCPLHYVICMLVRMCKLIYFVFVL